MSLVAALRRRKLCVGANTEILQASNSTVSPQFKVQQVLRGSSASFTRTTGVLHDGRLRRTQNWITLTYKWFNHVPLPHRYPLSAAIQITEDARRCIFLGFSRDGDSVFSYTIDDNESQDSSGSTVGRESAPGGLECRLLIWAFRPAWPLVLLSSTRILCSSDLAALRREWAPESILQRSTVAQHLRIYLWESSCGRLLTVQARDRAACARHAKPTKGPHRGDTTSSLRGAAARQLALSLWSTCPVPRQPADLWARLHLCSMARGGVGTACALDTRGHRAPRQTPNAACMAQCKAMLSMRAMACPPVGALHSHFEVSSPFPRPSVVQWAELVLPSTGGPGSGGGSGTGSGSGLGMDGVYSQSKLVCHALNAGTTVRVVFLSIKQPSVHVPTKDLDTYDEMCASVGNGKVKEQQAIDKNTGSIGGIIDEASTTDETETETEADTSVSSMSTAGSRISQLGGHPASCIDEQNAQFPMHQAHTAGGAFVVTNTFARGSVVDMQGGANGHEVSAISALVGGKERRTTSDQRPSSSGSRPQSGTSTSRMASEASACYWDSQGSPVLTSWPRAEAAVQLATHAWAIGPIDSRPRFLEADSISSRPLTNGVTPNESSCLYQTTHLPVSVTPWSRERGVHAHVSTRSRYSQARISSRRRTADGPLSPSSTLYESRLRLPRRMDGSLSADWEQVNAELRRVLPPDTRSSYTAVTPGLNNHRPYLTPHVQRDGEIVLDIEVVLGEVARRCAARLVDYDVRVLRSRVHPPDKITAGLPMYEMEVLAVTDLQTLSSSSGQCGPSEEGGGASSVTFKPQACTAMSSIARAGKQHAVDRRSAPAKDSYMNPSRGLAAAGSHRVSKIMGRPEASGSPEYQHGKVASAVGAARHDRAKGYASVGRRGNRGSRTLGGDAFDDVVAGLPSPPYNSRGIRTAASIPKIPFVAKTVLGHTAVGVQTNESTYWEPDQASDTGKQAPYNVGLLGGVDGAARRAGKLRLRTKSHRVMIQIVCRCYLPFPTRVNGRTGAHAVFEEGTVPTVVVRSISMASAQAHSRLLASVASQGATFLRSGHAPVRWQARPYEVSNDPVLAGKSLKALVAPRAPYALILA